MAFPVTPHVSYHGGDGRGLTLVPVEKQYYNDDRSYKRVPPSSAPQQVRGGSIEDSIDEMKNRMKGVNQRLGAVDVKLYEREREEVQTDSPMYTIARSLASPSPRRNMPVPDQDEPQRPQRAVQPQPQQDEASGALQVYQFRQHLLMSKQHQLSSKQWERQKYLEAVISRQQQQLDHLTRQQEETNAELTELRRRLSTTTA
eukprot:TRINITY_DN39035_c0_g1_i1.p1 TRINITY_DN39035_c0_g1~~TRINITY_DN39035_c0_g1_i1.p1  ORF type:complete len:201 (+),score=27.89 TRINITY_DN39035_c0_g1_i1:45-647(+)